MLMWFSGLAAALVACVLGWAGLFKVFARSAPATARRSALAELVGADRAPRVLRLVGGLELLVACLLLVPPVGGPAGVAAAGLSLLMLGYLGYARVHVPESSCGCLSARTSPVGPRHFARAGLLFGLSLLAVAGGSWLGMLAARPAAGVLLFAVGALVVVAVSPDLDHRWLIPLRRAVIARRHPLGATVTAELPVAATMNRLTHSDAYRAVSPLLCSDVLEHWDTDGWRIVTYAARDGGRRATAVFAVPLADHEPHEVRVSLVEEPVAAPAEDSVNEVPAQRAGSALG